MTSRVSTCEQITVCITDNLETWQPNSRRDWIALGLTCSALLVSSEAAIAAGICYAGYKWATAEKLPNPDTVQTIYTPSCPSPTDLQTLHSHARKIAQLKNDPRVMGIAFAPNREGALVPIYIRCQPIDNYTTRFSAHDLAHDKDLGFAIVHPFLASNDYLKEGYWLMERDPAYEGYGPSKEEVGKVWIDMVKNTSKYKNIGVILNKAIQQKFQAECQGRIVIDAVRNSHPFHYKLGFRSQESVENRVYASYARNHQTTTNDLGSVHMYLPDQARELWLEEVRQHPIGFPI